MSFTPPIGRIVDTSRQPCGYSPGDTDATDCPKQATWHICWDTDGENGLACDEHMSYVQERHVYFDRHPVEVDCAMPGATWYFEENRCGYPGEDTPAVAQASAVIPDAAAQDRSGSHA